MTVKLIENTAKGLHSQIESILPNQKFDQYLDVGCGSGALLKRLSTYYKQGSGTDINQKSLKYTNFKFVKSNINEEVPFNNKKFDLITCVELIEHLENPQKLLRELSKRLNKNGILILTTPNIKNVFSRFLFLLSGEFINFRSTDTDHITPILPHVFEQEARNNGLKVIKKYYSDMHIPFIGYFPLRKELSGNVLIYILKKN